jgi:hypothetical protein
MVVLATHTPLTRVLPAPQAAAICVIIPSGREIGAGVKACADVATDKAKPATAINLIILLLPHCPSLEPLAAEDGSTLVFK